MAQAVFREESGTGAMTTIKELEQRRLRAMRTNDPEVLKQLLARNMIYIHESGRLYHRDDYIRAIQTRELSYQEDVELEDEEVQVLDNLFLATGIMKGHGLLDGERLVFNIRYLAVWGCQPDEEGNWRLLSVQKTAVTPGPLTRAELVR